MLGLSARAVGTYAAFAYPLALLCAIPYLSDLPADADDELVLRRLRTATVLTLLAPLHILFPLTALGLVRDVSRHPARPSARSTSRARTVAVVGVAVSVAVFVTTARAR